jgi:hypothetical protein
LEFHSPVKKNERTKFASKWMELQNCMLSEVTLAQKLKYGLLSFICGSQLKIYCLVCLTWSTGGSQNTRNRSVGVEIPEGEDTIKYERERERERERGGMERETGKEREKKGEGDREGGRGGREEKEGERRENEEEGDKEGGGQGEKEGEGVGDGEKKP